MPNAQPDFAKPETGPARLAVIDECACVGCTKCIAACPFDAILGAAKQMHTVLAELCTGCALCVAPCPVDCIAMYTQDSMHRPPDWSQQVVLNRYRSREDRLLRHHVEAHTLSSQHRNLSRAVMRQEIAAAVERSKAKQRSWNDSRLDPRTSKGHDS